MKSMAVWLKALLIGLLAMIASLAAMAICAAAQLDTAVLVLGWPIFLFVELLSTGELVTSDSPENPLPLIAGISLVHHGLPGKAALIFRKKYSLSR